MAWRSTSCWATSLILDFSTTSRMTALTMTGRPPGRRHAHRVRQPFATLQHSPTGNAPPPGSRGRALFWPPLGRGWWRNRPRTAMARPNGGQKRVHPRAPAFLPSGCFSLRRPSLFLALDLNAAGTASQETDRRRRKKGRAGGGLHLDEAPRKRPPERNTAVGAEGGSRAADLPPPPFWASHRSPPPARLTPSPIRRPGELRPPRPRPGGNAPDAPEARPATLAP